MIVLSNHQSSHNIFMIFLNKSGRDQTLRNFDIKEKKNAFLTPEIICLHFEEVLSTVD